MNDSAASSPEHMPPALPAIPPAKENKGGPVWLRRTIVGAVIAGVLVIAYFIAALTVPLSWANAIKSQVGPQMGNAIPLGMFYGFVFSFVPVLVAWQAHHKKLNNWVSVAFVVVGMLLTTPNLLTLSVLYGNSATARRALSIWDTGGANWFGTWSQIFMVVGIVCAVAVILLGRLWLRRGKKIREIKAAEKLLRENEIAKERAAKEAGRAAEKAAKENARVAERVAKESARAARRDTGTNPEA